MFEDINVMHPCLFILIAFELNVLLRVTAVETSNDDGLTSDLKVIIPDNCRVQKNHSGSTMSDRSDLEKNRTATFSNRSFVPMNSKKNREEKMTMTTFPDSFDVREKFGERCPGISRVYNQGQCRSGWAIAIASVISDRLCIKSGGKKQIMLSAQNLLSCCLECCGCKGGNILNAWHWVMENGIVTGSVYQNKNSCMPYMIPPAHPKKYMQSGFGGDWATGSLALQDCTIHCKDGSRHIPTKINGYELWPKSNHLYIMEQLMKYGPLQVSMHIYEDFKYYKEGIYIHQTGKFEGDHAVKLIGWGIWKNAHYWLAMNSFGNSSWGMNGTFMIPRNGEDNTDFGYAIISPILAGNRAYGNNFFQLNMFIGCLIILLYFR